MRRGMEKWGRAGSWEVQREAGRVGSEWLIVKNKCVRWWTNSSLLMRVCLCARPGERKKKIVARCWYKHTGPLTAIKRASVDERANSEPGKPTTESLLRGSSCRHLKFIIPLPFTFRQVNNVTWKMSTNARLLAKPPERRSCIHLHHCSLSVADKRVRGLHIYCRLCGD